MRDLPSGTVTFLFTDIEGSTKLLHELGPEGYAEALTRHRQILRQAFTGHGGVEVDTQGDAFFVAFPTADGAVAAAIQARDDLANGPIHVRMGLHTGTPHLTAEGYVGADVHHGARIAAAGHGGQILLSKQARDLVEVEVTNLGEHRLKDFDQAVPIFQVGTDRFPPLKTISNTNLPRPVSSFVGRDREIADVASLLGNGARLVTLTGPGGTGKTRLAIEAAAESLPHFKAGVFWVGLAPLRDPALVTDTIAATIGAQDGLAIHVGEREMLLVLDNFEQVIEAGPDLSPVLTACPNLKVLVTSREVLRLGGEVEYPVPPLADADAVNLFAERSGVVPDGTVRELCRRLDNLPLAVELAAARTRVLSPSQILDRLSKRLDDLKGGRDADPRQRTLRTTIQWSHDLLNGDERRLFARLAVFTGGSTLEAAEEVAGADVDLLESLVDKSLVRRTGDRFWMLETIREFAAERLDESADAEEVRRRHAEHFTAIAEAYDGVMGDRAQELGRSLEEEQPNLRSALDWATSGGDPAVALRLTGGLWRLWWRLGAGREGTEWYRRALAGAEGQPVELRARAEYGAANMAMLRHEPAEAAELLERCLPVFQRQGDALRIGRTLNDLGIAAQMSGDHALARHHFEQSLAHALATGDDYQAKAARINLANAAMGEGRLDDAAAALEEVLSSESDDRSQPATAHQTLSVIELRRGELRSAVEHVRRGLDLARQAHDVRTVGHCLPVAAGALLRLGDPPAAVRALSAASELFEESGLVLEAAERDLYEETTAEVKAKLGDDELSRFMDEARALGRDALLDRIEADLSSSG